ncbi:immunoglobulin-like domain-containing protein [Mangrovimonas aestuarii]|uniref:immunoglobulin-like domain-containing protein n=1 Tax=Mangrovimonas aestuarii TaxID=3018443 RepID=UPI0023793AB6|nr:immunoglobulin-like domain-containing protein [Mangrovimonas aestuarii]
MKNFYKIVFLFAVVISFSACQTDDSEDVSFVTEYAVFEYEPEIVLELGSTFEPSAVATQGGTPLEVIVSGDVDTNTVGVYDVAYSAVNSDGFEASAFQKVVVHDPSIVGTDVSGNIVDANNGSRTGIITLVEGTTSIFYCTDFGFAGNFPMYFQMDGDVISEIPQVYPFGATSVELTYSPATQTFTTLIAPYGFGYTFVYQ